MAFNWQDIKDMDVPNPNRFLVDGVQKTIVPDFGTPTEPGTPVNKSLLQKYEDYLKIVEVKRMGSIMFSGDTSLPEGYLPCNGAAISKSTYPELYAKIPTQFASLAPNTIDYRIAVKGEYLYAHTYSGQFVRAKIDAAGNFIGGWESQPSVPLGYIAGSPFVLINGNYIYCIGGQVGTTFYGDVYVATINADGSLSSWAATTSSGNTASFLQACVYGGYLYVFGGKSTTTAVTNLVRSAPINANGTIGTWTTKASIPVAKSHHALTLVGNEVTLYAGMTYTANLNSIHRATLSSGGNISAWSTLTPLSFTEGGGYTHINTAVVVGSYVYLGLVYNGSNAIYRASYPSLTSWTSMTNMNNVGQINHVLSNNIILQYTGVPYAIFPSAYVISTNIAYNVKLLQETTFLLPNLSDRFVVGTDDPGKIGGSNSVGSSGVVNFTKLMAYIRAY